MATFRGTLQGGSDNRDSKVVHRLGQTYMEAKIQASNAGVAIQGVKTASGNRFDLFVIDEKRNSVRIASVQETPHGPVWQLLDPS